MRKIVTGRRVAIVLADGTLLAVPPMPAHAPSAVRVKIFEYVLRRQPGLAEITAQIAADANTGGDAHDRLAVLMNSAPYTSSLMEARAA